MAAAGAAVDDPYLLQANLDNTMSKIMDMEEQIERQEEEVARLEMLVNDSDRCTIVVFVTQVYAMLLILAQMCLSACGFDT